MIKGYPFDNRVVFARFALSLRSPVVYYIHQIIINNIVDIDTKKKIFLLTIASYKQQFRYTQRSASHNTQHTTHNTQHTTHTNDNYKDNYNISTPIRNNIP